ncbi:MAG: Na+ dependent nucleoside transporter [Bacteroidales bacterium]|nr:Na+ dependent nucleoside transporter [Bacteroidales bacterium]MCL2133163.1 Na+ dependent nucleoside transporter [Bacteroidales bacterium]
MEITIDTLTATVTGVVEAMPTTPYRDILLNKTISFSFDSIAMGLLGLAVIIGLAWLFSTDRKGVDWKQAGRGLFLQLMIAIAVLQVVPADWLKPALLIVGTIIVVVIGLGIARRKTALNLKRITHLLSVGALMLLGVLAFFYAGEIVEFLGKCFIAVLAWTKIGSEFLFGGLMDANHFGFIFAFQILPTIIFFAALTNLFFYLGVIQKVVWLLAWLLTKAMRLSGAEGLVAAGNIFLGQIEASLLAKMYLPSMTRSEIMLVMTAGLATIAGGVLAAYIGMLGAGDELMKLAFAKHLLSASVMAAPGAVVIAKIIVPQREDINNKIEVAKKEAGKNILDAIANGATEGLRLAANVAAMLLVFYALIAGFNFIIDKIGIWTNLNEVIANATNGQYQGLSLEFILGYLFAPVIWLMGVPWSDVTLVGQLLGQKLIMTEFIGYQNLSTMIQTGVFYDPRSIIMAVYVLCGFANFVSVGMQIGGIGSLAPKQKVLMSQLGMRALLGGTLVAMISATMVGMFLS